MAAPSATRSLTLRRGLRDETGSCMIICMPARLRRSAFGVAPVSSLPLNHTEPLVGGGSCMMALLAEDLPQPDSPRTPSVSPLATSRSRPDTACRRCRSAVGNSTVRSRTRSRLAYTLECDSTSELVPTIAPLHNSNVDLVDTGDSAGCHHAADLTVRCLAEREVATHPVTVRITVRFGVTRITRRESRRFAGTQFAGILTTWREMTTRRWRREIGRQSANGVQRTVRCRGQSGYGT